MGDGHKARECMNKINTLDSTESVSSFTFMVVLRPSDDKDVKISRLQMID